MNRLNIIILSTINLELRNSRVTSKYPALPDTELCPFAGICSSMRLSEPPTCWNKVDLSFFLCSLLCVIQQWQRIPIRATLGDVCKYRPSRRSRGILLSLNLMKFSLTSRLVLPDISADIKFAGIINSITTG